MATVIGKEAEWVTVNSESNKQEKDKVYVSLTFNNETELSNVHRSSWKGN